MKKQRIFSCLIALILQNCFVITSYAIEYSIVDLGEGSASDINNLGQIVGSGQIGNSSKIRPVLWENGITHDLGLLEGSLHGGATAINERSEIIGYSLIHSDYRQILWHSNQMTDLGINGYALDINNIGQITGNFFSDSIPSKRHIFLYDNNLFIDLGDGIGRSINDLGQIVGHDTITNHAVRLDNGVRIDLGEFGGGYSYATKINDLGQIVGYSKDLNGMNRAFLWENETMTNLGALDADTSRAHGINNLGDVVGSLFHLDTDLYRAFVYSQGVMRDLNDFLPPGSDWDLYEANAINDLGQIVGYGLIDGEAHAFLMTPIPEPSTFLLLVTATILFRIKRKSTRM